jgi:NAD(P)-dependent dehydrogenase (short-subunit alcohol dehydrogenase family)
LLETPVFEINDKHILVTGASSGFGRHFARFLAANGARVTLAARVRTYETGSLNRPRNRRIFV